MNDKPRSPEVETSTGQSRLTLKIVWAVLIGLGLYGLYQAVSLTWVNDDAFISFRYAKNLIEGHGLVFNVGEVVEGYTNFLWTILIAGAMLLHIEPIVFTQVVGIISYLLTIGLVVNTSFRFSQQYKYKIFLPIAAAALLVHYDYHVYATSGLETSFAAFLLMLAVTILVLSESKRCFLYAGIVLIVMVLTRPDSMIFYLMVLPYIFLYDKNWKRNILYYLVPLVVIYAPYWLIRYSYYGYPFPNTYYAKSAYLSWYSQGLIYLWTYLKTYYALLLLIPAVVYAGRLLLQSILKTRYLSDKTNRLWLLSILLVLPYIFYVVRVGGDFMHARFFIAITPLCFLMLETTLLSLNIKPALKYVIGGLIVLSVLFRWNQFVEEGAIISGIIDERTFYPAEKIEQAKIDGARLKKYLADTDAVIGFYGAKAMLMYYSDAKMAIECHAGLTDEYLAHQPLKHRGRIGHEKKATDAYMRKRGINFIAIETAPMTGDVVGIISFDGTTMPIKYYENDLMNSLKKYPGVKFVDFPGFLDEYVLHMDEIPPEQVEADFPQFMNYYFETNKDTLRLKQFVGKYNEIMEKLGKPKIE